MYLGRDPCCRLGLPSALLCCGAYTVCGSAVPFAKREVELSPVPLARSQRQAGGARRGARLHEEAQKLRVMLMSIIIMKQDTQQPTAQP